MTASLVLTCIGPDKPGLVESLSKTVAAHDANWEKSRMAHLAGQFAGILQITVSQEKATPLIQALRDLDNHGLQITVQESEATQESFRSFRLELTGNDQPGIVREVSRVLASRGVNVEELRTECVSAAMSGGTLFQATAQIGVSEDIDVEELREKLEELSNEIMVDITLD
jgi:glycine cleavage system regulatory protein